MTDRLMRLRKNKWIRDLCAETEFNACQLIQPLFVVEGLKSDQEIPGLGDTKRNTLDSVYRQIENDLEQGVRHFILFHVPQEKGLRPGGFTKDQIRFAGVGYGLEVVVGEAGPD